MATTPQMSQKLVETLIPLLDHPKFDPLLLKLAPGCNNSERFLMKMELRRLAKPCQRIIDLRGELPGQCEPVVLADVTHYLDPDSEQEFRRLYELFGGYTFAIYERVTQQAQKAARESDKRELNVQARQRERALPKLAYGDDPCRSEERMYFAINIQVQVSDQQRLDAMTVNMSLNGLRIKVPQDTPLRLRQNLKVIFTDLKEEYVLPGESAEYQVISLHPQNEHLYVNLKRRVLTEADEFGQFLTSFIRGNKKRYKLELDHVCSAVMNRTSEHFMMAHQPALSLFIGAAKSGKAELYALLNDTNHHLFHYFQDSGINRLGYLLKPDRLKQWIAQGRQDSLLYCFYLEKNGKRYFYSALEEELEAQPDLKSTFRGYGARQSSWRVIRVEARPFDKTKAHRPTTLPDNLHPNVAKANLPPSARVQSILKRLGRILLLTDITSDAEAYQSETISQQQLARLQQFAHRRSKDVAKILPLSFSHQGVRHEPRYQINTLIQVENEQGKLVEGQTQDLSCTGIKIKLDKDLPLLPQYRISLPRLQDKHPQMPLQGLDYDVLHRDSEHKTVSLRLTDTDQGRQVQRVLDAILTSSHLNQDKEPEGTDDVELGQALKNTLLTQTPLATLLFSRQGARFVADHGGSQDPEHPFWRLFPHQSHQLDVSPLTDGNNGKLLQSYFKRLKNQHPHLTLDILACCQNDQPSEFRFTDSFDSDKEAHDFIRQADKKGQFIGFKLFLCRSRRPNLNVVDMEMRYLSSYMMYKARELEDRLWNITAVVMASENTREIRQRLALASEQGV